MFSQIPAEVFFFLPPGLLSHSGVVMWVTEVMPASTVRIRDRLEGNLWYDPDVKSDLWFPGSKIAWNWDTRDACMLWWDRNRHTHLVKRENVFDGEHRSAFCIPLAVTDGFKHDVSLRVFVLCFLSAGLFLLLALVCIRCRFVTFNMTHAEMWREGPNKSDSAWV